MKVRRKTLIYILCALLCLIGMPAYAEGSPDEGYDIIPSEIYIPVGDCVVWNLSGDVIPEFTEDFSKVADCSVKQEYSELVCDTQNPAAAITDGHYYRLYNQRYNTYISSVPSDSATSLLMVADPDSIDTVWKAESIGSAFSFYSQAGYMNMTGSGNQLALGTDYFSSSQFTLQPSNAYGCEGSFGLFTDHSALPYRLDIVSSSEVTGYINSEYGTYSHTSFYFYEVTGRSVSSTQISFKAKEKGTVTFTENGNSHTVHVYDPDDNRINLNGFGSQVTASGCQLPDDSLHDEGFFSYECNREDNTITFTASGSGSCTITIGGMEYEISASCEYYIGPEGTITVDAPEFSSSDDISSFCTEYISVSVPENGKLEFTNKGLSIPEPGKREICSVEGASGKRYDVVMKTAADVISLKPGDAYQLAIGDRSFSDYSITAQDHVSITSCEIRDTKGEARLIADISRFSEGNIFAISPSSRSYTIMVPEAIEEGIRYTSDYISPDPNTGTLSPCNPSLLWELTDENNGKYHIRNIGTGEYVYAEGISDTAAVPLLLGTEIPEGALSWFEPVAKSETANAFTFRTTDGELTAYFNRGTEGICLKTVSSGFYFYEAEPQNGISFHGISSGTAYLFDSETITKVKVGSSEARYKEQAYSDLGQALREASRDRSNQRLADQVVTLMGNDINFSGAVPAGVLIDSNSFIAGYDEILLTYSVSDPSTGAAAERIYPSVVNGKQYLFLPSAADYSSIDLKLPKDTVVTDTESGRSITLDENGQAIDISTISDKTSQAGAKISLSVVSVQNDLSITQNVILMKSDNVCSLYVDLDPSGKNDVIDWLNCNKNNEYDSGNAMLVDESGTAAVFSGALSSFHARGNSGLGSGSTKPSYAIKTAKKSTLAGNASSKSWCLISNPITYRDMTTYGTVLGDTLYQWVNSGSDEDPYVTYRPTDLYINGEYRGMYIITDKINDDRVPINASKYSVEDKEGFTTVTDENDPAIKAGIKQYIYSTDSVLKSNKEGGYVIEICGLVSSECSFISKRNVPVEIKEPGTPTQAEVQRIAIYYQEFEDALYSPTGFNSKGKTVSDYADLTSLARLYLVKGFLKDYDFYWGSTYFYINADNTGFTSLLKSCTAWDFDACTVIRNASIYDVFDTSMTRTENGSDYKYQLLKHGDFTAELKRLSTESVFGNDTDGYKSFTDLVNDFTKENGLIDQYFDTVNSAMLMNTALWSECTWSDSEESRTSDVIKSRVSQRLDIWNSIWNDQNTLSGITVSESTASGNRSLKASTNEGAEVQWYSYGSDSPLCSASTRFTPSESGIYYASASGIGTLMGTDASSMISEPHLFVTDDALAMVYKDSSEGKLLILAAYASDGRMLCSKAVSEKNGVVSMNVSSYIKANASELRLVTLDPDTYIPTANVITQLL